jgi:hypothetical protein
MPLCDASMQKEKRKKEKRKKKKEKRKKKKKIVKKNRIRSYKKEVNILPFHHPQGKHLVVHCGCFQEVALLC